MNTIANKPVDLRDRTLEFSRDIIIFCKTINRNQLNESIIRQLIRSSTSIGANFIEAKDSGSKKDYRNKVLISKKEASETLYWLRLCEEFTGSESLPSLQQECKEIILILQKIIDTLSR
jgi:four helix bundle protein